MSAAPGGVIFGRFVTGVGVGISAISATAYIGEMAAPSHRGRMVQIYEVHAHAYFVLRWDGMLFVSKNVLRIESEPSLQNVLGVAVGW